MDEHEMDNVMPNDYFMPREPANQVISRKREKAHTMEALPILLKLLDRLEKRIAFYESVRSISDDIRTDPEKFLIAHNSNTLAASNLISEREWIAGLIEDSQRR